MTGWNKR